MRSAHFMHAKRKENGKLEISVVVGPPHETSVAKSGPLLSPTYGRELLSPASVDDIGGLLI